jgi:hypothetical protein
MEIMFEGKYDLEAVFFGCCQNALIDPSSRMILLMMLGGVVCADRFDSKQPEKKIKKGSLYIYTNLNVKKDII